MAAYVPEAGDIVWMHFTPHAGHKQAGSRPAVVLSPASYNRIGLMLCCPMTTKIKDYPFEVAIANSQASVALADQVKSLDWQARKARWNGSISADELAQVRSKAVALIRG